MKNHIFAFLGIITLWLTFETPGAWAQSNTCDSVFYSGYYSKYTLVLGMSYVETNSAGPVLNSTNAFVFEASVGLGSNLTASGATLTVPGEEARPMRNLDPSHLFFAAVTNSLTNLTAEFPTGEYLFTISNNTTPVNLPAEGPMPNPPSLVNFAGAQSINPAADFTLAWNAFQGGEAKDFVSVSVSGGGNGSVFQSASETCPGALDGTDTSIVIPANTLSSNQNYSAVITFVRVLTFDTNSIPRDALLAGLESETEITISTGAASSLVLLNASALPGGAIAFDLTTTPGVTYTIQFNPNLDNSGGWTSLLTTNAAGSLVTFTNSPGAGFYRAFQN